MIVARFANCIMDAVATAGNILAHGARRTVLADSIVRGCAGRVDDHAIGAEGAGLAHCLVVTRARINEIFITLAGSADKARGERVARCAGISSSIERQTGDIERGGLDRL